MAGTNETKQEALNEKETEASEKSTSTKENEDDVWFCYLASTFTSAPDIAGNTTTTEIYHCTWYGLN